MITSPKIEELAFRGRCRWAVQWFGIGTAGTVTIPPGGFAILRQIIHRPYFQPLAEAASPSPFVHQLTLTEQGSLDELQYIFRDSPTGRPSLFGNQSPVNSSEIIETWGVFKKNIEIDLINIPKSTDFVYSAASAFNATAQERPTPLGFGALAVNSRIDFSANEKYFPAGQQRPILGALYGGAGVRDRLRFDVNLARAIQPINGAQESHDFQYPIIGLGLWIFNIPVSEYLNQ